MELVRVLENLVASRIYVDIYIAFGRGSFFGWHGCKKFLVRLRKWDVVAYTMLNGSLD